MSKKGFVIILTLSVVVTYGVALVESFGNPAANRAGLPFKFGSFTLFGEASTDYPMLIVDIIFWFIVLWVIWKIIQKVLNKG